MILALCTWFFVLSVGWLRGYGQTQTTKNHERKKKIIQTAYRPVSGIVVAKSICGLIKRSKTEPEENVRKDFPVLKTSKTETSKIENKQATFETRRHNKRGLDNSKGKQQGMYLGGPMDHCETNVRAHSKVHK